jgi:hypothetical protein
VWILLEKMIGWVLSVAIEEDGGPCRRQALMGKEDESALVPPT